MSKEHTQTIDKLSFIPHNTPINTIVTVRRGNDALSTHYYPKGTSQKEAYRLAVLSYRAVNSHEALVSALENMIELAEAGLRGAGFHAPDLNPELQKARAALALAKEGN